VIYSNYKSFFIVKKQIITSDRLILVTRSFFSVVQYFLPKLVFGKKLHWVLDIDLESNGNGFFSRMSRKLSLSFCDAIVFQDSYQKSCFLKTVDSDRFEGKTFINTPGINIPAVINNSKYSQDKRKVRLISVANLSKRKNQLLIAEVASILKFKYNLGVEVLFFGKVLDYDYVNDITSALNSSNLNFSECFKGWSSSPFENLPDNSIFLLTSTGEGVSNSLQEAMLRGIIVFASKVGGAVDVVRDCETGFIVDSFDAEVWAEKIHSMFVCRDLSFISKISQSAASYSLESFTVESWVRKYLEIFEKV
jgi:glycosyltransferase involved in cell wall biosynthesis